MKVLILGANGFIGRNLAEHLLKNKNHSLILADQNVNFINNLGAEVKRINFVDCDFDELVKGVDLVFHLICTSIPSVCDVSKDIEENVVASTKLLDACVRQKVKRIIYFSSGGTVYGKDNACPLKEDMPTEPICAYGVQKLAIEKILYLYNYLYKLEYTIIRLSNPYGTYQRPNNNQGIIANFLNKIINNEEICVYGDGNVVRDYVYIKDAVEAIVNIAEKDNCKHKIYNLGSGTGTSINELISIIKDSLNIDVKVKYIDSRKQDVPTNYLDISRYESEFGKLQKTGLKDGIIQTYNYLSHEI